MPFSGCIWGRERRAECGAGGWWVGELWSGERRVKRAIEFGVAKLQVSVEEEDEEEDEG